MATSGQTNAGSLRTAQLDYKLPQRLIARVPVEPRDSARMLVVHSDRTEHGHVRDLPEYLTPDDLLVTNNTRVIPARLVGRREDTGGRVEALVLDRSGERWQVMLRSNGRLRSKMVITLLDKSGADTPDHLVLEEQGEAIWHVRPSSPDVLDRVGRTPLPPYILQARRRDESEPIDDADQQWYQTVYAAGVGASVAAPTAGLHFTRDLLNRLDSAGIRRTEITLAVGAGTFKPVTSDELTDHAMHAERFVVPAAAKDAIQATRNRAGRLFAVGTTTTRALESVKDWISGCPMEAETDLMITPGYEFRCVDGLLTNFHLPRSTLLALVAAKIGLKRMHDIYAEAIQREYRFYSYGDAMLIMPGCTT